MEKRSTWAQDLSCFLFCLRLDTQNLICVYLVDKKCLEPKLALVI